MSQIEDDYAELIGEDQECFQLVLGVLGAAAGSQGVGKVIDCARFLVRHPHVLGLTLEVGEMIGEDVKGKMVDELQRRVEHTGQTGVLADAVDEKLHPQQCPECTEYRQTPDAPCYACGYNPHRQPTNAGDDLVDPGSSEREGS